MKNFLTAFNIAVFYYAKVVKLNKRLPSPYGKPAQAL